MELDVHLSREGDQPWGFSMIGGADFGMPLTVVKVLPNSSAELAGLQNGDTVSKIGETIAIDLTHDAAMTVVDEANQHLVLGVSRGLYDPVLDDQEPIYESIDTEDFDRQSQPSEVQFAVPELFEPIQPVEFDLTSKLYESRSETASPFVLPVKPYRPFSTEPLPEIPPLEDPIILNPNYKDDFGKRSTEELFPETKFKLPISEQYDPDGSKRKARAKSEDVLAKEAVKEEVRMEKKDLKTAVQLVIEECRTKEGKEKLMKDELQFMEKMKQEIDLDKIEMTASTIVDESIERAVSVAEEIKKEIDVELLETTDSKIETKEFKSESISEKEMVERTEVIESKKETIEDVKQVSKDVTEVVEVKDKTTEEVIRKETVVPNIVKEEKYEEEKMEQKLEERRLSTKKEIEESIEVGSVKRKSMVYEKEVESKPPVKETEVKSKPGKEREVPKQTEVREREERYMKDRKEERVTRTEAARAPRAERFAESIYDARTSKTSAEERAYRVGLQTIPNIRGYSTYHYNLLLRTFFVHLTDVMVALTRFMLAEPIFDDIEQFRERREDREERVMESRAVDKRERRHEQRDVRERREERKAEERVREERVEKVAKEVKEERQIVKADEMRQKKVEREEIKEDERTSLEVEEIMQKRKLSGAEMSQRTERKSAELTQKMGAVISEFETKSGIDESTEAREMFLRRRRSSSRSQIEEEVAKESDPLVWLDKVDSRRASEERTEYRTSEMSTMSKSMESKKFESKHESRYRSSKHKEPKNTYIAIVEAHVYTNKDFILEDLTEISETSSVQSAEEISTAFEAHEAMSTEKVEMMKHAEVKKDVAKAVVEKREVMQASAQKTEAIKEESVKEMAKFEKTEAKHKTKIISQEAAVQQIVQPVIQVEELKRVEVKADIAKAVAEEREVSVAKASRVETSIQAVEESIKVEEAVKEIAKFEKTEAKHETKIITQEAAVQEIVQPMVQVEEIHTAEVKTDVAKAIEEEREVSVVKASRTETAVQALEESVKIEESLEEIAKFEKIEAEHETRIITQESAIQQIVEPVMQVQEVEIKQEYKEEKAETKLISQEAVLIQEMVQPMMEVQEVKAAEMIQEMAVEKVEESTAVTAKASIPEILVAEISLEESAVVKVKEPKDASAELTVRKEVIIEQEPEEIVVMDESELISRQLIERDIKYQAGMAGAAYEAQMMQAASYSARHEASYMATSMETTMAGQTVTSQKDLALDYSRQISEPQEEIATPSPSIPATPLTDEYVFKFKVPLPKSRDTSPIPRDPTPEKETPKDEDPNIVKKKLIPHIETTVESPVIFDPPLPTPPEEKPEPVYTKPGLKGGADRRFAKEEIKDIERKSSLLASAIDETIRSIEEYKEEVGMETKREVSSQKVTKSEYKSSKTVETSFKSGSMTIESETVESTPLITKEHVKIESKVVKSNGEIDKPKEVIIPVKENGFEEIDLSESKKETKKAESVKVEMESAKKEEKHEIESKYIVTEAKSEMPEQKSEKPIAIEVETDVEASKTEGKVEEVIEKVSAKSSEVIETEKSIEVTLKIPKPPEIQVVEVKEEKSVSEQETKVNEEKKEEKVAEIKVEEKKEVEKKVEVEEKKIDPLSIVKPVKFDPEEIARNKRKTDVSVVFNIQDMSQHKEPYMTETGEVIGTIQGIVDSLEDAVVDEEVAKELGKPGMPEEKIAELISGESEMLREAHVMGLTRVLSSHMHRADDDSSVDFKKIKPLIESLNDSEVLKALNEDLAKSKEEKKKEEEKKWTTFLQKPKRPVPKAMHGYHGYMPHEEVVEEPYKVKIVKQPKPKVAPDYKPEDFDTGPLPWEVRALSEPDAPFEPEEPILVPEEVPEFLEAVDPLPESEVPDLEETGIPLPPPPQPVEELPVVEVTEVAETEGEQKDEEPIELDIEAVVEETEKIVEEMEQNRLVEQLLQNVQSMVDPNASLEQQLNQMRAQLAALAQLPGVIQQTLETVTRQLSMISQQEVHQVSQMQAQQCQMQAQQCQMQTQQCQMQSQQCQMQSESYQQVEMSQTNVPHTTDTIQEENENQSEGSESHQAEQVTIEEMQQTPTQETKQAGLTAEEMARMKREEEEMLEEQKRMEKQKKEVMEQRRLEQEARQLKQRPTPRVGKPQPKFGPPHPIDRPLVLPGGRKWRSPKDVYDEQMIAETLSAQAELIQGKAKGTFESDLLPYDDRINFMKYEKPPVSLDHLQHSEVYKMVHNMDETPLKRVELLTPVIAEADYRERCRSQTPSQSDMKLPQQFHP